MSKTIYIVTSGIYSDYNINAVFDTKELAEKFIEVFGGEKDEDEACKIEEYELNPMPEHLIKGNLIYYYVCMFKDGTVKRVEKESGYPDSEIKYFLTGDNEFLGNWCFATDEKHAVKITNELRARLIAENKWGEV